MKLSFLFTLGLPYGAFIFTEDEKKKIAEKEEKLAAEKPEIFKKDRGIYVDFDDLTEKEMKELMWDHYENNMKIQYKE